MSVTHDTIEGRADARGLSHHLVPCWCPRTLVILETCLFEWNTLPPVVMSGFVILLGSVVMSITLVTISGGDIGTMCVEI